jgi:hypothetical protein
MSDEEATRIDAAEICQNVRKIGHDAAQTLGQATPR